MPSWQAHIAVLLLKQSFKASLRAAPDVAKVRKLFSPPAVRIPLGARFTPGEMGGISGEWVEGAHSRVRMLYLHGGGYFACSPETHRPITAAFAREGFRVFAAAYRLAPEHKFPAALDDARAAYRGLLAQDPYHQTIAVAGDSAGGGLAVSMMLRLRPEGTRLPAAAALFSPWTDLAATGKSLVDNDESCALFTGAAIGPSAKLYLGDADPRNPLASPLYGDLAGLPPMIIHAAKDEVLRDDSVRLAERARAAGVQVELKLWPVVPHVWQLGQHLIPEAAQSTREAAAFLHKALEAARNSENVR
jgi:monoterpene epsilon-lactone hydrolase